MRHFPQHRQAILETLVKLRAELEPDLVMVHASTDTHQDHEALSQEAFRAFKKTSILGYELPHNCRISAPAYFNALAPIHVEAKIKALNAYESQRWRTGDLAPILQGLAAMRGSQINVQYAEAFEVMRWVEQ